MSLIEGPLSVISGEFLLPVAYQHPLLLNFTNLTLQTSADLPGIRVLTSESSLQIGHDQNMQLIELLFENTRKDSRRRSICLSEGAGAWGERQAPIGRGSGGAPSNFKNTPLDCKKTPFLNIKIHPILGYLLYEQLIPPACLFITA